MGTGHYEVGFNSDPTKASSLIMPIILGLIGGLFIVSAVMFGFKSSHLSKHGLHATGTVVGVKEEFERSRTDGKRRKNYTSVITFTDGTGEEHTFHGGGKNEQGAKIGVIYDPKDPSSARIYSFGALWGGPIALSLFGLVLAGFSVFFFKFVHKKRKEIQKLKDSGIRALAKVSGINTKVHRSKSKKGKTRTSKSYQLVASWNDPKSGRMLTFTSYSLSKHPGEHLVGTEISVFIDPENLGNYYLQVK